MLCFPNAKLNLGLNIVSKRPDGYHNLETVFYPIPVQDALEIVPAEQFSFAQTGIPVDGTAEQNLVVKAYRLLQERFPLPPLSIHLLKAIPFGAGLGGGSSDAAYMLKLLNEHCQLGLSADELEQEAARLGADCAFFVRNQPVFATGIGNLFEPIELSLSGYHLCLVKPDVAVSTREAYAAIQPQQPAESLKEIIREPVAHWHDRMINDFEASVFPQFPQIQAIKEQLYTEGALYASMTGSGSSVFGLFAEETQLHDHPAFAHCFVWEGRL